MNALALAILFVIRVAVPVGVLFALGEWMRRREKNYWFNVR